MCSFPPLASSLSPRQVLTDDAKQVAAKAPDGHVPVLKERYAVPEPKSIPPGATQEQGGEGGLEVVEEAGEEQAMESGAGQPRGGRGTAGTKLAPPAGEQAAKAAVPRAKRR